VSDFVLLIDPETFVLDGPAVSHNIETGVYEIPLRTKTGDALVVIICH
jgi:hypothetical protein